jgi:hypothetical protein
VPHDDMGAAGLIVGPVLPHNITLVWQPLHATLEQATGKQPICRGCQWGWVAHCSDIAWTPSRLDLHHACPSCGRTVHNPAVRLHIHGLVLLHA